MQRESTIYRRIIHGCELRSCVLILLVPKVGHREVKEFLLISPASDKESYKPSLLPVYLTITLIRVKIISRAESASNRMVQLALHCFSPGTVEAKHTSKAATSEEYKFRFEGYLRHHRNTC